MNDICFEAKFGGISSLRFTDILPPLKRGIRRALGWDPREFVEVPEKDQRISVCDLEDEKRLGARSLEEANGWVGGAGGGSGGGGRQSGWIL